MAAREIRTALSLIPALLSDARSRMSLKPPTNKSPFLISSAGSAAPRSRSRPPSHQRVNTAIPDTGLSASPIWSTRELDGRNEQDADASEMLVA
jgi:hypothetical protein